jgi:hypothetical protein
VEMVAVATAAAVTSTAPKTEFLNMAVSFSLDGDRVTAKRQGMNPLYAGTPRTLRANTEYYMSRNVCNTFG